VTIDVTFGVEFFRPFFWLSKIFIGRNLLFG
jgi:hypothetical protein